MITNRKKSDTHVVLKKRIKAFLFITILLLHFQSATSQDNFVSFNKTTDAFPLVSNNKAAALVIDKNDWTGVQKIAGLFQEDIEKVTSAKPQIHYTLPKNTTQVIVIGTLGKNKLIDELIKNKKIDVTNLENKWETTLFQVVDKPFNGVEKALVIAGSDKRGTIYGMFEISRKMGVSPWYWWADVPVKKHSEIYFNPKQHILGEPKVKYRGIFLNDEEPALGRWAVEKFGGFNHKFYEKVFELLLRQKANFLWPAMWWASFNSNDTLNQKLADEMGIVMSTSHHEPMMRAHAEWKPYGGKEWNFNTNAEQLKKFWREGIERMNGYESVVTLAMRGDGDEAMSAETNTELLTKIVEAQRDIIKEVTGKPIEETPQVWALYKEVQEYYDKGMRVPEDVTLLLCDDNWGDVRVLPEIGSPKREGGYGMYYHFDFVGGPRSYKWLNTSPLPRVWEQLNLTYKYGVDRIWLVNVGDLKPMELPITFFLDFAWHPEEMSVQKLDEYTTNWATEQFGEANAKEIGKILKLYPKYNARRKPESLFSDTYSLTNYREFENVVADYKKLETKAKQIFDKQEGKYKDAYYQLVYHPVSACANLNEMYYAHAKNLLYAQQGRAATNDMAKKVEELFKKDAALTEYYHTTLANGKWNHMMAQTHIGYNSWQEPRENKMPEVKIVDLPDKGELGYMIEGNEKWWPMDEGQAKLAGFDSYNQQSYFIELFNRGKEKVAYSFSKTEPWLKLSSNVGTVEKEERIIVSIDWKKTKPGQNSTKIILTSNKKEIGTIEIVATNYNDKLAKGFIEKNGYLSMEAANYTKANNSKEISWEIIPEIGRTLHGVTSMPVTEKIETPGKNTPSLEYEFYLLNEPKNGAIKIDYYLSPTLNFLKGKGLHFAVSVDDEPLQTINMHEGTEEADWKYPNWWNQAVLNSVMVKTSEHKIAKKGKHVLKFWLIDPGIVLQKIVIDAGGLKPSYLGPQESKFIK